jgi:hypothetical protein
LRTWPLGGLLEQPTQVLVSTDRSNLVAYVVLIHVEADQPVALFDDQFNTAERVTMPKGEVGESFCLRGAVVVR